MYVYFIIANTFDSYCNVMVR